jgi:hypothetical protein
VLAVPICHERLLTAHQPPTGWRIHSGSRVVVSAPVCPCIVLAIAQLHQRPRTFCAPSDKETPFCTMRCWFVAADFRWLAAFAPGSCAGNCEALRRMIWPPLRTILLAERCAAGDECVPYAIYLCLVTSQRHTANHLAHLVRECMLKVPKPDRFSRITTYSCDQHGQALAGECHGDARLQP